MPHPATLPTWIARVYDHDELACRVHTACEWDFGHCSPKPGALGAQAVLDLHSRAAHPRERARRRAQAPAQGRTVQSTISPIFSRAQLTLTTIPVAARPSSAA